VTIDFSVGVLGSGPLGRGISTLLGSAGYQVHLGTRRPAAIALAGLPEAVKIGSIELAARSEIVFLAVMHQASRGLVSRLETMLEGKILIDCDNAWLPADYEAAGLSPSLTEGRWMSQLLPGSTIVRAFNQVDWDLLVPGGLEHPGRFAAPYTTDSAHAAGSVDPLIFDMGYVPSYIGGLDESALDVGGFLWPGLYTPEQLREVLDSRAR
jgi:predicted dinucleotide-binding enzyme